MLKCVIFPVTAYYYQRLQKKKEQIAAELSEGNVELIVTKIKGKISSDGKAGKLLRSGNVPDSSMQMSDSLMQMLSLEKGYLNEELLFVTDSREVFASLREKGFYAVGLCHDKNRSLFFANALYVVENVGQLKLKSYDEAYRRLAGLPWDILETEHLKVRESTVADVDSFYRIYREPSITYFMEDLFKDPNEEKAYMESYIKHIYGFYGFGMWTVLLKETGEVIGRAGLNVREGYNLPELGFVIDVRHQGKGYASEACRAILHYAKEELLLNRVQALVQEENTASGSLLAKLGFQYEKNVVEDGREYRLMTKQL